MSALAGCFWRDGRGARIDDVAGAAAAAAHRSSSPFRFSTIGPAVLGGAGADAEPIGDPDGGLTIVFDGRIDNRRELGHALGAPGPLDAPRLILAAYRRWHDDAWSQLIGDFAFAMWDARESRLICVRDPLGQRPLFYAARERCVVFGSEPQQVLRHMEVRREVNEAIVAEHLAGGPVTIGETVWRGVMRLPPAHAARFEAGRSSISRYWDFGRTPQVVPCREDEYAEAFRDLFVTAVECRLDEARAPGLFLSGGVDSSAVAVVADDLGRRQRCPRVTALAHTWPGEPCDESAYIADVVRTCELDARIVPAPPANGDDAVADARRHLDLPQLPNGMALTPLRRLARSLGLDVVLTGYGGDDWFAGSPSHTTDLLRSGRVVSAARQWLADASLPGFGYTHGGLARLALAPLAPAPVRRLMRPLTGAPPPRFDWIQPDLARRTALSDRLVPPAPPPFPTSVQRDIYLNATCAGQLLGDELEDRAAHAAGIDQRHPFNDRRLVEFGFSLPESQRWSGRQTKIVIRRALRDLLPPSVLTRRDKAEFSSTYVSALQALGGADQYKRLRSEDRGWVAGDVVRRLYGEMIQLYRRGDAAYIPLTEALWTVSAIELWLEAIDTSPTF